MEAEEWMSVVSTNGPMATSSTALKTAILRESGMTALYDSGVRWERKPRDSKVANGIRSPPEKPVSTSHSRRAPATSTVSDGALGVLLWLYLQLRSNLNLPISGGLPLVNHKSQRDVEPR